MEVVFRPRTFREPWNHHVPFNSSTDCRAIIAANAEFAQNQDLSHERLRSLTKNIIEKVQNMIPAKLNVLNNDYFEFHISSMEENGPFI